MTSTGHRNPFSGRRTAPLGVGCSWRRIVLSCATCPRYLGSSRFLVGTFSQFWQHAGEDFQTEVLLIPEAVGPSLKDPDFVVDALHEAEGHLVLRAGIGLDPIPVGFDHPGETLEWL